MTVYYRCPVCGADVDDDPEWDLKYPIVRSENCGTPYHKNCGIESHYEYCQKCKPLKSND